MRSRENIRNIFLISVHKHMHTPEYQRPVALTRLTFLAHLTSILCALTSAHVRAIARLRQSRASLYVDRVSGPNSIYMVRARALELNRKNENEEELKTFFFPIVTHCPLDEVSAEKFQSPKCPFNLLESCLETFVGEICLYFLY